MTLTSSSVEIEGIPGTEASASKRGYYYQDVVTALTWVGLRPGQALHIEVAEDKAVVDATGAEITQIRDVANSLTLVGAVDYLERVVDLMRTNAGVGLQFVYHTTAKVAPERSLDDRPNAEPGLTYWERVRNGADPKPLVDILRRLARQHGNLAAFLAARDDRAIADELVSKVTWATNMPRVAGLETQLAERVAEFAHDEVGLPWTDGRELAALVMKEITKASFSQDAAGRTLNRTQLAQLLKSSAFETVPISVYRQISRDAALAKNASTEPLDREVERRLLRLRQSRTLLANAAEQARALADDVREGGRYELCTDSLRATALAWCARILSEPDATSAKALLMEAKSLGSDVHIAYVDALLVGRDEPGVGLGRLANETDPVAQTVRYLISRRHSRHAALEKVVAACLLPSDFDADGMFFVLVDLLHDGKWAAAIAWAENVPEEAFDNQPPLLWGVALTLVASCVPEPAKPAALEGPPLIRELRLKSDPRDIATRRRASELFRRFHEIASQLGIEEQGDAALEYALWLELKDRTSRSAVRAEILQYWTASGEGLRWLPLALLARVPVPKRDKLEGILGLAQKKYGALSYVDARALMALILDMPVDEWLDRWSFISDLVRPHLAKAFLEFFEVEAFLRAGRFDDARDALTKTTELPIERQAFLESEIERATSSRQSLQALRAAASGSDRYAETCRLIEALVEAGEFNEAIERAEALYNHEDSHDLADAERWLGLLAKAERWPELETHLDGHPLLVEQSHALAGHYLVALTRHGRWKAAKKLVDEQPDIVVSKAYFDRTAAILSGNWEALHPMLEDALASPGLDAEEQLQFAALATILGRVPAAKRLVLEAMEQRPDDPGVLWSGYMVAVRGKWEDEPVVGEWVRRAIANSGEDGPIQRKSFSDLRDMLQEGNERNKTVSEHVAKGDLFLGMVAEMFGRPLASLILETAESNQSQRDFRKLSPICAFAGVERQRREGIPGGVAIDQTALLTLGNLRLLPKVGELFQQIWVPYSVFDWLFNEVQDAKFHQPSRVYEAHNLLRMLGQQVKIAQIPPEVPRPLIQEVGDSMAQLIRAAEVDREQGKEAFVVRPAPIHRVNSWGEEEAEVSDHVGILRSTREVIRSLKFHELLIESRADACEAFLQRHDRGWPGDERVPQRAILYLDSVTVSYFHYLNLWDEASRAFTLVIHPEDRAEAVALARTESASENLESVLEDIRKFLLLGMEGEKVQFLRKPTREATRNIDKSRFLFLEAVERQDGVEAIIVDDRAGNKYPNFSYPQGNVVQINTSLEILQWMHEKGMISERDWFGYRNALRRSGYLFIPIEARELHLALENAIVRDGSVLEPAGARAIRENLLLAQASGLLQIPNEAAWLTNIGAVVMKTLTSVWGGNEDDAAIAKANWLVELCRWDGFAGRMPGEWTEDRVMALDALALARLFYNGPRPQGRVTAYNKWLEDRYVEPLKQARPRLFDALCQHAVRQLEDVPSLISQSKPEYSAAESAGMTAAYCKQFINDLPTAIREKIFENTRLLKQLGLSRSSSFTAHVEGKPVFDTDSVFEAASQVLAGKGNVKVKDRSGEIWKLSLEPAEDTVVCGHPASGRLFQLLHAQLASPDPEKRVSYLIGLARQFGLTADQIASWVELVRAGPIVASLLPQIERDLGASPMAMEAALRETFASGSAHISDLIPGAGHYYERLVVPHGGAATLLDYIATLQVREEAPDQFDRIRQELLWSIHPQLVPVRAIRNMSPETLRTFCEELMPEIDLWSLTGLIEAVAGYKDLSSEVLHALRDLITKFVALTDAGTGRLRLTTALGGLVDGSLNQSGLFAAAPVFWRRLASLAHAALVERCMVSLELPIADMAAWAEQKSQQFQMATLADLQREPRWEALMFSPPHLHQKLLGRVIVALEARRPELPADLENIVFGDDAESLLSKHELMISALPGPLEGGTRLFKEGNEEFVKSVNDLFVDEKASLHTRIVTVAHVASVVEMPDAILNHLAATVEAFVASESFIGDSDSWTSFLSRLSLAASGSKHLALSAAVLQLIRSRHEIPFATRVYMGIVTCGAQPDEAAWLDAVAEHMGYCSRLDLARPDAEYLLSVLQTLETVKPLLRPKVAELGARLRGFVMGTGRAA